MHKIRNANNGEDNGYLRSRKDTPCEKVTFGGRVASDREI